LGRGQERMTDAHGNRDHVMDSERSFPCPKFACQNELGRLCDESVYETDLAARLRADGFRDVENQLHLNS